MPKYSLEIDVEVKGKSRIRSLVFSEVFDHTNTNGWGPEAYAFRKAVRAIKRRRCPCRITNIKLLGHNDPGHLEEIRPEWNMVYFMLNKWKETKQQLVSARKRQGRRKD